MLRAIQNRGSLETPHRLRIDLGAAVLADELFQGDGPMHLTLFVKEARGIRPLCFGSRCRERLPAENQLEAVGMAGFYQPLHRRICHVILLLFGTNDLELSYLRRHIHAAQANG